MLLAGLIDELFRLRMTSIATSAVVMVNRILQCHHHVSNPIQMIPVSIKQKLTHHSKAANTQAARAERHAFPPHVNSLLRKTARAMKPANQKSMVRASMARMANLWAARGKSQGERVR